jgi:response regulator RpfG family c-di-GMP phosphodiesterase
VTTRLVVLVVEDEPEVRDALVRDLRPLAPVADVEAADDAEEAAEVVAELAPDQRLALVLADHRLPGRSGVDLLVDLESDPRHASARKVLVTGQADLADTVRAVNLAGLDHFVAKPWDPAELDAVVRDQLTAFVADHVDDVLPYLAHLDAERLLAAARRTTRAD